MSMNRREFMLTGAAAGAAAAAAQAQTSAPPRSAAARPPRRHLLGQRPQLQERRPADLRRARLRDDDRGQGRARRAHRRRQHRRARSRGHERRLRRPAQRRRRRAARRLVHARAAQARRRRRVSRRRAHAVARGAEGDGRTPITTCSSGRTRSGSRAAWASRSRTTSTPSGRAPPGWSGNGGPIRCTISIRSSARRRCARSTGR